MASRAKGLMVKVADETGARLRGPELLARLLNTGFEQLSQQTPVAMTVANAIPEWPRELPWQVLEFESAEDLSSTVAGTLIERPVLILPPWEDFSAQGMRRVGTDGGLFALRPANSDALLAMIVPAHLLTASGMRNVRELLFSSWSPLTVVYGANLLSDVHSSFVAAVVFLGTARSGPLRIFQVPSTLNISDEEVCADFRQLVSKRGGQTKYGYVLPDSPEPGDGLAFDRYHPDLLARKADLAGYGFTVPLGELFGIHRGLHLAADRALLCASDDAGAIRVIEGRHLQRGGWIAPVDDRSRWARIPDDRALRAGDILLRTLYDPAARHGLVVVEVTDHDLPAVASDSVMVLRALTGIDDIQRSFVLQFLRLPLAHLLIRAESGGGLHLSMPALRELQLPQPDRELRAAVEDLMDVADQFSAWRQETDDLLSSMILDDTAKAARARIVSLGRNLRQREQAASALDDHGYIVRTRFPYPVALRWRQVEATVSAGSTVTSYRAILDAAEVLLCYAANLVLALAHHDGTPIRYIDNLRTRLVAGKGGPGLGDWVAILDELRTRKAYRTLSDTHPLAPLRGMLSTPEADGARRRLTDRRNGLAHGRSIDEIELPTEVSAALDDLRTLLKAADFLPDFPLVHVTDMRWDTLRRQAVVSYQGLSGDHPVVPTKAMSYDTPAVERGSLYVLDDQHRLHLLRPMLTGRTCPVCRTWSTFHIDRVQNGHVVLKSLEHGHTVKDATVSTSYAMFGLL